MKGSYVGRAKGGKLLRVALEWEGGTVGSISVHGDFFAHPEDAFDEAERGLAGCALDGLGSRFGSLLAAGGVTLYGLLPEDLDDAVRTITGSALGGAESGN